MMDRSRFLVATGVDPIRWASRFDIEPASAPCGDCGRTLTTSLPFAVGKLRGLVAPTCTCGNVLTPYCVVAAEGDLLAIMTRRR
jgi:hypothetical protein